MILIAAKNQNENNNSIFNTNFNIQWPVEMTRTSPTQHLQSESGESVKFIFQNITSLDWSKGKSHGLNVYGMWG